MVLNMEQETFIFYGGSSIFGGLMDAITGGGDDAKIEVPEPPKPEDDTDAERKRMRELKNREAARARKRTGRQKASLLTGSGSTASAPTRKASLLGRTAQA